jgi:NitT/TauT family transport system permease protein
MKNKIVKISMIVLWLLIWQIAAIGVNNDILLAGPIEVGKTLVHLCGTVEFYRICLASMERILLGFCMALFLGMLLGILSYQFGWVRTFAEPLLQVMKSIPVASFVVLLLIWQGARNLSVWISFFVVFPNACISTRNGLEAVEPRLKEMADIFGIRGVRRAVYIYRPSLVRYLLSGMEVSVGMAFKSGVAAEVIGVPDGSIGERIYVSKIYLDTPGLFAWTVALIALSFLAEKIVLKALHTLLRPVMMQPGRDRTGGRKVHQAANDNQKAADCGSSDNKRIRLSHVSKSFDHKQVLCDVNMELESGGCYLLMGPSGSGKTTLLRILAGLEELEDGSISQSEGRKIAYLFQEDRLLENELTITNIMLTAKTQQKEKMSGRQQVEGMIGELLPRDCLDKPARTLSGGMKRRCALARAMLYEQDNQDALCLLDEPFAGLDEEAKQKAVAFIRQNINGRTLIVASHEERDAELLGGGIWKIAESL